MKKILTSALVIMAVLLCVMSQAWAETGKIRDTHDYGGWRSFLLQFSEGTISRMHTTTNSQSALLIDFYPNGTHYISVCVDLKKSKTSGIKKFFGQTVSGKILVGKGKMHDVRFQYGEKSSNGQLYINLYPEFCDILLQEAYDASHGEIRIKVEGIKRLFEYSLNGFDSAMDRCKALLEFLE